MKIFNALFLVASVVSFSSCLKAKNEFGGMRTDEGNIVTSIVEKQYLISDESNNHWGYEVFAGFDFAAPATESVRFFAVRVNQPRDKKLSGPMTVRFTTAAIPGLATFPAGAITFPTEFTVPANAATVYDVPVYFTVNKSALNPASSYGISFTLTGTSQGVFDELSKTVDIQIKNSKYTARYTSVTSVTDSANLYRIVSNTKPTLLEDLGSNNVGIADVVFNRYPVASIARAIQVINLSTGGRVDLVQPRYVFNAAGNLTAVLSRTTGADLNAVIEPSSKFTYTSNDNRTFVANYTIRLTVGGINQPFKISENWTYGTPQAY